MLWKDCDEHMNSTVSQNDNMTTQDTLYPDILLLAVHILREEEVQRNLTLYLAGLLLALKLTDFLFRIGQMNK